MKLEYGEYKAMISVKRGEKPLCDLTTWRGDFINRILDSLPTVEVNKGETVSIVLKPAEKGENGTD